MFTSEYHQNDNHNFFSKKNLLYDLSATQATTIKVEVTKVRILSSGLCLVLNIRITHIKPVLYYGTSRLVDTNQHFGGTCRFHIHGRRCENTPFLPKAILNSYEITQRHFPADTFSAVRNLDLRRKKLQHLLPPFFISCDTVNGTSEIKYL
jgi:hypothetical protein